MQTKGADRPQDRKGIERHATTHLPVASWRAICVKTKLRRCFSLMVMLSWPFTSVHFDADHVGRLMPAGPYCCSQPEGFHTGKHRPKERKYHDRPPAPCWGGKLPPFRSFHRTLFFNPMELCVLVGVVCNAVAAACVPKLW